MNKVSPAAPAPVSFCSPGLRRLLLRLELVTEAKLAEFDFFTLKKPLPNTKIIAALAVQGVIDENQALSKIAAALSVEIADLKQPETIKRAKDEAQSDKIGPEILIAHRVVPLQANSSEVFIAMADPLDTEAISSLEFIWGKRARVLLASECDIVAALSRISGDHLLREAAKGNPNEEQSAIEAEDSLESAKSGSESAPVVRLVNKMLSDACEQQASDVHLEPTEDALQVRFRVDGVLSVYATVPKQLQNYVLTRLKILAGMDITIRRRPQDGRFVLRSGQEAVGDARVSTVPTPYGEKLVLRLLRSGAAEINLDFLDMPHEVLQNFKEALAARDRMVVVTGPTGSGKSTTLYAALHYLRHGATNIITVEDPVEYRVEGITQIQVDQKAGMTFASGLRSILRQDPDIIMVGEIRDRETAEIGFQAAQTGHLVLSTLHTNTAASAVVRLVDLGIEPFIITSSLGAVMSQRLLRRVCHACARELSPEEAAKLEQGCGIKAAQARIGRGCRECGFSGYRGRIGVYSLLSVDAEIGEMIRRGAAEKELEQAAAKRGWKTLFDAGSQLVEAGISTFEELVRVVGHGEIGGGERIRQEEGEMGMLMAKAVAAQRSARADIDTVQDLLESFVAESQEKVSDFASADSSAAALLLQGKAENSVASLARVHRQTRELNIRPVRILVVDDDEGVRAVVSRALRKADYDVSEACDGLEALEMIAEEAPDFIVSDLVMPQMDGEELLLRLRGQEKTAALPVLVLTGSDDETNEIRLLEAGATDFISKSVSPAVLLTRIKKMLAAR